jgi:hypothetical protein
MTQAQGCVLIPLCNHHSGHRNDVGTTKRLLRGVVPTQDRSALKTSSRTGCIRLGWQLAAERPAFRLVRGRFVGLAGLEPAASSLSGIFAGCVHAGSAAGGQLIGGVELTVVVR